MRVSIRRRIRRLIQSPIKRLWKRLADPLSPFHYLLLAASGATAALIVALVARQLPPSDLANWASARDQCLVVAGLLLLPASIFPAVVGSMFPKYWNATPVIVIAHHPVGLLLKYLAAILGYALVSLIVPATWGTAVVLVSLVLVGLAMAIRAIAFSLAVLDPLKLAKLLRNASAREKNRPRARQAFGDLCRLVRGFREAERLSAASTAIWYMSVAWRKRANDLQPHLVLADRVVKECWEWRNWSTKREMSRAVHAWERRRNPQASRPMARDRLGRAAAQRFLRRVVQRSAQSLQQLVAFGTGDRERRR